MTCSPAPSLTPLPLELEYRKQEGMGEAGVINDCTFPQLESLILINCPLREDRLFYIAAMHQETLRTLELHRLVFIGTPGPTSVENLADICKDFLPSLMHLALSKIGPYAPDACHSYSDTRE